MKVRQIGIAEAYLSQYGTVFKGQEIEVADKDGENLLRQVGMWESAEPAQTFKAPQNKKLVVTDAKTIEDQEDISNA